MPRLSKGRSGNPSGRPKHDHTFTDALRSNGTPEELAQQYLLCPLLGRCYFLAKRIGLIFTGASRIVNSDCPSATTFISNLTTSSSSFSSKLSVSP